MIRSTANSVARRHGSISEEKPYGMGKSKRIVRGVAALAACAMALAASRTLHAQDRSRPLDTVRVSVTSRTGVAARESRSVTVVTREEIDRTAARTLADLLVPVLGADIRARSPASGDVALRGASSEGVVVMVDGVRVSDQQSGHFDLDLAVPLDLVDHVEVLRGTSSALYGADAVGGVINIVTRGAVGARAPTTVSASGGSFGTASLAASGEATVSGTRVSGALDASRSDGHRTGTDYRATQARAAARRATASGVMRLDAGVGVRHFGAADFYGPYPSYEDTRSTTASARYDVALGDGWALSTRADTRRHADLFTLRRADPALYQNRHVSWQSGAEALLRRSVASDIGVAVGVEANDLRLASARLGHHDERRGALFSEATVALGTRASMDVGARTDWSSDYGTFVSPTLALAVPLGARVVVRASAARGYRTPTWTERYYLDPANIGDPDLTVERFWSGEGGVHATISPRLSLDGAAFVRRANGLIDWAKPLGAADSVPWRTMNVDRATYRGIEARADLRRVAGVDWTLNASGLAVDARGATGYRGKYALSPITRSLGLSATLPVRAARLALDGALARRLGDSTQVTANARLVVPVRRAMLTLDVFNLTDASYRDVSGAPIAGRAAYLGARWTLR